MHKPIIIAIVNEKGGTGKTTTTVNLSAAMGELGKKVLLVDLDGQAASSRWLGVEEDNRLADALYRGRGLEPIPDVMPNVSLAPASGKLDSVAHDLRPTQGGQLRKVLLELADFDFMFIDCPPSLGNRLIGNALLAATHVIVPVETSILALDGLRILLTTLDDVREGFGHELVLGGVVACRFDPRTRLSRLVLAELRRALPGKVFETVIRENVRMRECPASGQSILGFAGDSHGAEDYRKLAREMLEFPERWMNVSPMLDLQGENATGLAAVGELRGNAAAKVREATRRANQQGDADSSELLPVGEDIFQAADLASPEPVPTPDLPELSEPLPAVCEPADALLEPDPSEAAQEARVVEQDLPADEPPTPAPCRSQELDDWLAKLTEAEQRLAGDDLTVLEPSAPPAADIAPPATLPEPSDDWSEPPAEVKAMEIPVPDFLAAPSAAEAPPATPAEPARTAPALVDNVQPAPVAPPPAPADGDAAGQDWLMAVACADEPLSPPATTPPPASASASSAPAGPEGFGEMLAPVVVGAMGEELSVPRRPLGSAQDELPPELPAPCNAPPPVPAAVPPLPDASFDTQSMPALDLSLPEEPPAAQEVTSDDLPALRAMMEEMAKQGKLPAAQPGGTAGGTKKLPAWRRLFSRRAESV